MGFRYRKSVKLGPFRATVSKTGVSYSAGVKGARVTKRADGRVQTTLSVPRTGASYVSTAKRSQKPSTPSKPAPRPVAARPAKPAKPAKPARPPKPLPGNRSSITPRPPQGWAAPRMFEGRDATVSIYVQGIQIDRSRVGQIGNRSARIEWREVVAVDFLDPRWGRLGHVHFATAADARGLTMLGRNGNRATVARNNPHTIEFSSRQRPAYEELRRFIGG